MAKLTVDGVTYEVAEGRTIMQALDDLGLLMNGVDIPHYCWHPKLTIDGSCRLCQVEVEGFPKLQIGCNTPVKDGMVVHTKSERVRKAREGVMELLLVNHPLDCPICDQAGECKLQDYAFEYGVPHARTEEPRRALGKHVDLGPTIVFDQERCILCRRCVRFCREVPKTGELGIFNRGDRSVVETFPGTEVDIAASTPPLTNTSALAAPASARCVNSIVLSVKKPLAPMKKLAREAPTSSTRAASQRRIKAGVHNAPTK